MNPPARQTSFSRSDASRQRHELAGIEVLRFVCALAVLVWHYQHFLFVGQYDAAQAAAMRPALPLYWLLRDAYEQAWWPVEFFWVISGFIFYRHYAQPIFERRVPISEFATRRFSRLYPLHIVSLMLVALLQYIYARTHGQSFIYDNNTPGAFLSQLFFASYWFSWQTLSFNGPVWSISAEILIYFLFFCTVRALGAKPVIAIVMSGLGGMLLYSGLSHLIFNNTVFECTMLFFAGGVAQWLSKQRLALALSICVGAPIVVLLALQVVHICLSVIVVLAMCFVLFFARFGETRPGSILRRFSFLGNATYSSYLLHFPIQLGVVTIVDAVGYDRAVFLSPIVFITYMTGVIAVSLAVYHLLERPAQDWIRGRLGGFLNHTLNSGPLTPKRSSSAASA